METITKGSLLIEAERKAAEQPRGPRHPHVPGPRARTRIPGFFRRRHPGTGHRGDAPSHNPPWLEGAGRGWRGPWCAEDRSQRGVPSGEGPHALAPIPQITYRPGTPSELGILHPKCPDLWPRRPQGRPSATLPPLARACGQEALRVEPSQEAGVLLLLHPLPRLIIF